MSFLSIENGAERKRIVDDYINIKKELWEKSKNSKVSEDLKLKNLHKTYRPILEKSDQNTKQIVDATEQSTKELKDIIENPLWREDSKTPPYKFYTERIPTELQDQNYGIYLDGDDGYKIGETDVTIKMNNDLEILGKEYRGTPGLWGLIMLRHPVSYSDSDFQNWVDIVNKTDLELYARPVPGTRPLKTNKYKMILNARNHSDEFHDARPSTPKRTQVAHGITYLPSSINGLLQRLQLVTAERSAGNVQATTTEIVAILDELLRQHYLTKNEYNLIMKRLSC